MGQINTGRVIAGGLLAGLVMNIIDFLVNAVWLGRAWEDAVKARGVNMTALQGSSAAGWIVVDFIAGLFLVWIYSGFRPRFGPGPKTALLASLAVWGIGHLVFASYAFMGMLPWGLVVKVTAGGFVAVFAAGLVGCWLYKEER